MTLMTPLPHTLERMIVIEARPTVVFSFFTDSDRWASWWGAGSSIEPHPGGRMLIRYPNGTEVSGEVLEVVPPRHIVFTYGFSSGQPIPPGSSRVTIRLEPVAQGTRLHFSHEFSEPGVRDDHVQGWRYQLSLFANVVADAIHGNGPELVDAWFASWSETDAAARERQLAAIAAPTVRFRDRFSALVGIADLLPHISASQRFMPGLRLIRTGGVRHCQGVLLADWIARGSDGSERASGTNVFTLDADGLITDVTGLGAPRG